jgi:hypothetical protein
MSGPGFDLGLTARPLTGLSLRTGISWNDLEFDEDAPAGTQGGLYFKGDRAPSSPKYGLNVSADYVFPLGGSGLEGAFSISANHTPAVLQSLTVREVRSDSQWIARAGFALHSQQHWEVMLFADNLTNWDGATNLFPEFTPEHEYYNRGRIRPRTIGVQVDYHLN